MLCPDCGSERLCKDGLRYTNKSQIQRYLCRDCGYRFSNKSYKECQTNQSSQICVLKKAKNLDTTTKIKTVAGDLKRLPEDKRGLLTKFAAYLDREGYDSETSYYDLVKVIAKDGADLMDPEDVKTKIAKHLYQGKDEKLRPWKESVKMLASYAFDAFYTMEGISWSRPKYKQKDTILLVPDEKLLDALILGSQSRRMAAFLRCLKEPFADPGEILALQWKEIKEDIITIAHPCKGHLTGQYKVSARLISMLNSLPKNNRRVFPTSYDSIHNCLCKLKKKVARKLQDPAVLDITFKSYRHWGGSMIAHVTNGNVLKVKKMLRHKSVLNTMKYIHTINFAETDFEETVAVTSEEIRKCGKEGWTKYDERTVNGTTISYYRKPKRFGGLQ
jgi:integrase